jgi:hypothetical protein
VPSQGSKRRAREEALAIQRAEVEAARARIARRHLCVACTLPDDGLDMEAIAPGVWLHKRCREIRQDAGISTGPWESIRPAA